MRISRNWLADYVDFDDLSDAAFEELITTRVAEVDKLERSGEPIANARLARIEKVAPHPKRDNLLLVDCAVGETTVQVVCGAKNCRAGELVAYVPPGGVIFSDSGERLEVRAAEIAGLPSAGVLASERELGISNNHEGIFVLGKGFGTPGAELRRFVGDVDSVLVIDNKSLTHRPDLWGHFGFAREVAAILGRPLKVAIDSLADDHEDGAKRLRGLSSGKSRFAVQIAPATQCRRMTGVEFRGVKVAPSPLWMKRRLYAVGAGVRNLLIDLSNYVMQDIGQPNHAYDASLIQGNIVAVRLALADEEFIGLDDVKRRLTASDVVIADQESAIALAGVVGGKDGSIKDSTTDIFLESANFDPVMVRLTAKRHQLRTDASNRFEKSQSPYAVPLAIHRFSELLRAEQPQAEIVGEVADCFPHRPLPIAVQVDCPFIERRLGAPLGNARIQSIVQSLGFRTNGDIVTVPYFRATRDIQIAEDIVEEVGRIHGYENISEQAPLIESRAQLPLPIRKFEHTLRELLRGAGFSECYNYSFSDPAVAKELGYSATNAVKLENPIDSNMRSLRTTLVPGMLAVVERNARFFSNILLFELGRSYEAASTSGNELDPNVKERRRLCLAYGSGISEDSAQEGPVQRGGDFYALCDIIRRVIRLQTRKQVQFLPIAPRRGDVASNFALARAWMHPYRNASLMIENRPIGMISEVRKVVLRDVPFRTVCAELDLEELLSLRDHEELFQEVSRYPDSFFEISVVMPERTPFRQLEGLLQGAVSLNLIRNIEPLQVYIGEPLAVGEKSVSVRLSFQASDRTLSSEELVTLQQRVMTAIEKSSFSLRA